MIYRVTADVFCVEGTAVNWVLVRDGRDLTLIDAGYPGDLDTLLASIREIGHRPEDVRAALVTHAHVDHVGALGYLHERYGVPALMHSEELANATGLQRESATAADLAARSWRPAVLRWSLGIARSGAMKHPEVSHAEPFAPAGPLDLPGEPVPVHLPGHTSGSTAYLLPGAGIAVTGDALITGHPISAIAGPQLLPDFFTHDPASAMDSLDVIADLPADLVVPGHGSPWRGDVTEAAKLARSSAPRRLR